MAMNYLFYGSQPSTLIAYCLLLRSEHKHSKSWDFKMFFERSLLTKAAFLKINTVKT